MVGGANRIEPGRRRPFLVQRVTYLDGARMHVVTYRRRDRPDAFGWCPEARKIRVVVRTKKDDRFVGKEVVKRNRRIVGDKQVRYLENWVYVRVLVDQRDLRHLL